MLMDVDVNEIGVILCLYTIKISCAFCVCTIKMCTYCDE